MEKFPLKGTALSNNTVPQNHQYSLTTYQSVETKVILKQRSLRNRFDKIHLIIIVTNDKYI